MAYNGISRLKDTQRKIKYVKDMQDFLKSQIECLEKKTSITEANDTWDQIMYRLETAEEKISKLEDITIETIQNKTQRKKTEKTRTLVICGTTFYLLYT